MHSSSMRTARRLTVFLGGSVYREGGVSAYKGGSVYKGESAFPWYCGKAEPPGQTNTCENITLLQLRLRAVKIVANRTDSSINFNMLTVSLIKLNANDSIANSIILFSDCLIIVAFTLFK